MNYESSSTVTLQQWRRGLLSPWLPPSTGDPHLPQELQQLRSFTADQLSHLEQNHQNLEQDLEKMQNISRDISKAMKGLKDMEDMEGVKMKMCNMTQNVDELSEKMAAMEIDLNEQAITASAVNGHLESGVATAKQDRDSGPGDVCSVHWISLEILFPRLFISFDCCILLL